MAKNTLNDILGAGIAPAVQSDIEADARREVELELQEEAQARLKKTLKAQIRREMERDRNVEDPDAVVSVRINLAPHSSKIVLDGEPYYNGLSYELSLDKARVVVETMNRTWQHEREIGGANVNFYANSGRGDEFYTRLSGRV